MKRLLSLLISLMFLFVLMSCQPESDNNPDEENNQDDIGGDVGDTPEDTHTHTFGEWYVIEEATCQTPGLKEATCNCGEKLYENTPKAGHKMVDSACVYCNSHYSQGLEFESLGDGKCAVTGIGECTDTDLIIPDVSPDGETVTAIGYSAFDKNKNLESVYIPASVTSIGGYAFDQCSSIQSFTVDENNENYISIDGNLYLNSYSLKMLNYALAKTDKEFSVPYGVKDVSNGVFYGSQHLEVINFPETVIYISGYAFIDCAKLSYFNIDENNRDYKSIDGTIYSKDGTELVRYAPARADESFSIPDGVKKIEILAFASSTNLKNILIPASLEEMSSYVFMDCIQLENFYLSDDLTQLPYSITEIPLGTFSGCSMLKNVIIPEGIKTIGRYAFYQCCSIESITIPDSVESINEFAFSRCSSLSNVSFGSGLKEIGKSAFDSCSNLTSPTLPDSLVTIGYSAFWDCNSIDSFVLPKSLMSIDKFAFYCNNLNAIYYKGSAEDWNNVEYETDNYFKDELVYYFSSGTPTEKGRYWRYVDDVPTVWEDSLPPTSDLLRFMPNDDGTCYVVSMGNCTDKNLVIPQYSSDGHLVTGIGYSAFSNNSFLESVVIPDTITFVDKYAFSQCEKLEKVTIGNGVTIIDNSTFRLCTSLKEIIIPDSVVAIEEYAFYGCSSLTNVNFGNNLNNIGDYAFYSCSSLSTIDIPESVSKIGFKVFVECSALTSITVDENNTVYKSIDGNLYQTDELGYTLIQYAIGKTESTFIIPEGVYCLDSYSISKCVSLEKIYIPKSVQLIYNSAFGGCTSLTDVFCESSEEDWVYIYISEDNECLTSANFHYESTIE